MLIWFLRKTWPTIIIIIIIVSTFLHIIVHNTTIVYQNNEITHVIRSIQYNATELSTINHENGSILPDWLEVADSNRGVFIYSAFYDTRDKHAVVRVVAILRKKSRVTGCLIRTSTEKIIKVNAISKVIQEGWALKYSAAFVLCQYKPEQSGESPQHVAVLKSLDTTISGPFIPVELMHERTSLGYMSVCVKPFHYAFNRALWLVEFIEMYRLIGVDHFIFYNHTVGFDVDKVLRYYVKEEVASVYSWTLPVISQQEIRTEGIFASLNDCNLRSVKRFSYSAFVDIDEFILPRNYRTLPELLDSLGNYDGYIFQNAFFYLYWNNDTSADELLYGNDADLGSKQYGDKSNGPYLLTAYKTTRITTPHKHGMRSKYISKPEKTIECGNHIVWSYVGKSKKVLNVNANDAITQHYRICEFGGFECLNNPHEIDRTAHQWLKPLFQNVTDQCKAIFPQLSKCPVAPPLGSPW